MGTKTATRKVTDLNIIAKAGNVYGDGLWDKETDLVLNAQASNTDDTALDADADIRKLANKAMYYQTNKYGGLQLVLKYGDGTWSYISLMHAKDGTAVVDENHTYDIIDCAARRDFELDGDVIIAKGDVFTKAFSAS